MESHRNSLQPGYQLHWYVIKKILGQGGFGITYLALDTNLNQEVAIKEFLPIDMAVREGDASIQPVSGEYGEQFKWGLDRFMSEAQTLAKFKHPNIVRVLAVFPENNTAYIVMEYEHGHGMHELLKKQKTLDEPRLKEIVYPIIDGLAQIHKEGFIHRDIKPPNIFIREDGSPVLLDFGSARQSFGIQTRTLTSMVSPGFAPFEQYVAKSAKQGPWTDIYGLSATLYRSVTGRSPADAMDRSEAILHADRDIYVPIIDFKPEGFSPSFLSAIDHGLAFKPDDRPQKVEDWRNELEGGVPVDQSEIETVVDPAFLALNKTNKQDEIPETKKTEIIEKPETGVEKKKPSFFKRIVKYAAILIGILFLLSLLEEKPEQVPIADEPTLAEEPVVAAIDTPDAEDSTAIEPEPEKQDIVDETERIHELLSLAERDIRALRLTKPEGNNAYQKYQSILELDPSNADAQEGLLNIGTEYLKLTEQNIHSKDFDKATHYLNLAQEISPDHPDIPEVEKILNEDIQAEEEQKALLAEEELEKDIPVSVITDTDKRKLHMLSARLKTNPRDRHARKEIQTILKSYESEMKDSLKEGDLETAETFVNEALEFVPRSERLQQLQKQIGRKKAEISQHSLTPGTVFTDKLKTGKDAPEVVVIPSGSFQMGSSKHPREFFTGEFPIHKVTIDNPFAIMTREVTLNDFSRFVDATDYRTEAEWQGGCGYWDQEWKVDPERNWKQAGYPQSDNHPVVCVSWNDANTYARWLTQQTGETWRLPTEAEWEYAARADHKGETYWGDRMDRNCQYENLMDFKEDDGGTYFECTDGYLYTSPAAMFHPNSFGVHDMLGNVLEMTMDCFNENYRNATRDGSAATRGECGQRMLRGGAWALPRGESNERPTVTGRIPWAHNERGFMVGFRLVREIK